ncbi:uncharacterized protein LOC117594741 isoform X3 [Esox lucius]|uniref:uncharacterized protein LOC117594741 isoform X3 n=1 Tax=Esox lucius TaxID=8010 RepID=UPI001476D224|nr:uncharacterized protein LOC117594741 isoform X3 [Esox lucius]
MTPHILMLCRHIMYKHLENRELACRDTMLTFDQLVDMAIRLDNLLATHGHTGNDLPPPAHPVVRPEPMEVGGTAQRETVRPRECSFCGRKGHSASHCFQQKRVEQRKPDTPTQSQDTFEITEHPAFLIQWRIQETKLGECLLK